MSFKETYFCECLAFIKCDDHWGSDWVFLCGFVPMIGQPGERSSAISADGMVTLHYDVDQPVDVSALQGVLGREKSAVWSDATIHGEEPFDRIWLHLTATDDGTVRISAEQKAIDAGLCTPAIATRSPALVDGDSLAYLTVRRTETPGRWQLGVIGHGPAGRHLATRIINQIDAWDHNRTADPEVFAYPIGTPVPSTMSGEVNVITKPSIHLVLRYPPLP